MVCSHVFLVKDCSDLLQVRTILEKIIVNVFVEHAKHSAEMDGRAQGMAMGRLILHHNNPLRQPTESLRLTRCVEEDRLGGSRRLQEVLQ